MVEGERIEVSIDRKKMIALKDSELGRGKVAIFSEQSLPLTVIDDFIVKALSKKGAFSKKENGKNNQLIAQNLQIKNSGQNSEFKTLNHQLTESYLSLSSRFSRSLTEKGPNEGNYPDSLELNELNEPLNSSTLEVTNSPTPELTNSSIPEPSPDPIYQTTSSLPPNEIVYYYHHDHLGNIRAVTDSNGNVVERHDFYPFGEEISQPQSKDQYLFTGKPRDSESGLDYFGARYYRSFLSRFMSVDPKNIFDEKDKDEQLEEYLQKPQSWNKYTYTLNNPLKLIDPDGRAPRIAILTTFQERIRKDLNESKLPGFVKTILNILIPEPSELDIIPTAGFAPAKQIIMLDTNVLIELEKVGPKALKGITGRLVVDKTAFAELVKGAGLEKANTLLQKYGIEKFFELKIKQSLRKY
jgi:RHS repeat-associated protein